MQSHAKPPFETPTPPAPEGSLGPGPMGCHCLTLLSGAWTPNPLAPEGWHCLTLLSGAWRRKQAKPAKSVACIVLRLAFVLQSSGQRRLLSPLLWRAPPAVDRGRRICGEVWASSGQKWRALPMKIRQNCEIKMAGRYVMRIYFYEGLTGTDFTTRNPWRLENQGWRIWVLNGCFRLVKNM